MAKAESPTAMVIAAGCDVHHDMFTASLVLQSQLADAGIRTRRVLGLERFVEPMPATVDTDVYVLYTAGGQLVKEQQTALADLVAGGKGVVALHSSIVFATDGSVGSADRARSELLGSRYLSHGPDGIFGHYKVEVIADHPITEGIQDFEVDDEYYSIELIKESEPHVLMERDSALGREPILYVREHGAGRVCYLSLGHDMRVWGNPGFQVLLSRAVLWASGCI